ncbi:disulfide bond formation protein DsbA [Arthrobacter alpinus]|uniref:Disulfide bond formation protein DsbA n=1 Tax=Arthrobacter alpinus TaxID=656366 RepID=A0A0M4RRX8_9MICC|nr:MULTISPECIES: DsbA family oxidoreductase [Arthrobacter]ALE93688.1 disulfide bond formation protein DsbA [Arthrobacter alpinus]
MKIEIWSDVACPWCYIGKRRFETALNAFPHKDSVQVQWRSYQLDPTLPEHYDGSELDYLVERKGMDRSQLMGMLGHVKEAAEGEGLHYKFDGVVVANSFKAHELLHLAAANGKGDAVKEALLSGHFEHGVDIGNREALVRIGTDAGLPAVEITEALDTDKYADDVRHDFAEARALGVSGVPFFVIDRKYGISGAQPADVFSQALEQAWQEANPLTMVAAAPSDGSDAQVCGPDGCAI